MEIKSTTLSVKCIKCSSPILLSIGRFVGGCNDSGGLIIDCDACRSIFPVNATNPRDGSAVQKGGKTVDFWIDDFPNEFEKKYNIKESDIDSVQTAIVIGHEEPPIIPWNPAPNSMFNNDNIYHEVEAQKKLNEFEKDINQKFYAFEQYYRKGRCEADTSFVVINYKLQDKTYKAIFAKKIESEHCLNSDNLYLISHSGISLESEIDGIYTRNQSIIYLERLLNRWRYTANEILLVVPFVGFFYKNSQEALVELWDWLEQNIDTKKTNLVTRKGTFNLYKKATENFKELVEWGLLEPLIKSMNDGDMTYFQKSHAKYYVGVYENRVEVLSGSFNIHTGEYLENLIFKKYDKDVFKERYIVKMLKGYDYSPKGEEKSVHYIEIGDNKDINKCIGLNDFINNHFQ